MFTRNLVFTGLGVVLAGATITAFADEGSVPVAAAAAAPTMPIAQRMFGPTFAGAVASGGNNAFALRVTNRDHVVGPATVTLLSASTGAVLGVWTSPSIPGFGGYQDTLADIAAHATPALTAAQMAAPMNVQVRTSFAAAIQMVAMNSQSGALSNLTACGALQFEDISLLGYVEGAGTTGVSSAVRIVNTSMTLTSHAHLTLYNAASGAQLATWDSANIPPNGSLTTSTSAIVAAATPAVPANVAAFTVVATPTRNLRLEHVVMANGTLGDLTNACN